MQVLINLMLIIAGILLGYLVARKQFQDSLNEFLKVPRNTVSELQKPYHVIKQDELKFNHYIIQEEITKSFFDEDYTLQDFMEGKMTYDLMDLLVKEGCIVYSGNPPSETQLLEDKIKIQVSIWASKP